MLSVMIVDDEVLARIGVKSLIPWEENGFELVAECDNGRSAYEMAKKLEPDIIITDVKMPVMTGIELLRALKEDGISSKFVMLSAYDDYELVRTAMKEGADDYILKLRMEPEEVIKILMQIRQKIESEKQQETCNTDKGQQKSEVSGQTGDRLINDICFGILKGEADIANALLDSSVKLKEKYLTCLVVKIEQTDQGRHHQDDFFRTTMTNMMSESIRHYGSGHVVFHEPDRFVVCCSINCDGGRRHHIKALEHMTLAMLELLTNTLNVKAVIGIGNLHEGFDSIRKAYKEAMEAAYSSIAFLGGSIIRYRDAVNRKVIHSDIKVDGEMNALAVVLKNNDIPGIRRVLERLVKDLVAANDLSENYLVGQCHVLIFLMSDFISINGLSEENIWGGDSNPYMTISSFRVKKEYVDWIRMVSEQLFKVMDQLDESNIIIMRAKQYVHANIGVNISLSCISDHLGLSASYFSRLFSEVTSQRFIDYVTREKIKIAMELIRTTNKKIYEVADAVGYENVHYFSRVFRKTTGISPMEFKSGKANASTEEVI